MSDFRNRVLRTGLSALYASGAYRLMAPVTKGVGAIFMLHQVCPDVPRQFDPNRILRVTPEFLEMTIEEVRKADVDIVSLDEANRRLANKEFERRFACFTLDDGYKDNQEFAYPIFKAQGVPFTVYVPSDFAYGRGELWWLGLQEIIETNSTIHIDMGEGDVLLECGTDDDKIASFDKVYWWLRSLTEAQLRDEMRKLAGRYEFDFHDHCRKLIMSWDEVRALNEDPLVTIGAHTVAHFALAKIPANDLENDMRVSKKRLEQELGEVPLHLSFPYGDELSAGPREFESAKRHGFKTAVTTRKGPLFAAHSDHLTSLPRISLNGDFQSRAFVSLYLSGAPFALWNGFRQLNVN